MKSSTHYLSKAIYSIAACLAVLLAAASNAATPAQPIVAGGLRHSLFVTNDGRLWAMGLNNRGQLGDGTNTDRSSPVQVLVPNGLPVIAVSVAGYDSLYVTSDGKLWAMGDNSSGQLGDGTTTDRTTPVQVTVPNGLPVIAVAAGGNSYSLFVTNDGKLWAMGSNGWGQLGDGTDNITKRTTPVQVAANVIAVSAGAQHSLFVTGNGNLWAMGYNATGELGDGTTTNRSSPVQVKNSLGVAVTNVIAVAAGGDFSLYVTSDGKLWAMGGNFYGQLGNGATSGNNANPMPVQVATNVTAVAAGGAHSMYLTNDGKLWAMGWNTFGQLGDGTTTNRASPVQVMLSPGVPVTNVTAIAVGGYHSLYVTSDGKLRAMGDNSLGQLGDGSAQPLVTAGFAHSLYVTSGGKLWAMGDNTYGQLGDGTTTNRATPMQVMISPEVPVTNVTAASAGNGHSLYVTSDAKLWAMGKNDSGQLGDGTTTSRASPVPVMASPGVPAANVIAVAAGGAHSLYVTNDGRLWAMGDNTYGQLGDGTTTNRATPVPVMVSPGVPATNVIAASAGGTHSLYVTNDGKLWAMGDNTYGQLGDGTTTNRATPVPVMVSPGVPATNVIAASAGGAHSLYMTRDGALWGMGMNRFNQLCLAAPDSNVHPTPMPTAVTGYVKAAVAGSYHNLYVASDGKLWAIGDNTYGQLGSGTTAPRTAPVQVAANAAAEAAGGHHSLYVTSDGKLWAMGDNTYGQLGDDTTISRTTPVQVDTGLFSLLNTTTPVLVATGLAGSSLPAAPTITAVSRATAQPGDTITITGANLTGATVTIGGVKTADVVVSPDGTTLTFTVPPNATTGAIVVMTNGISVTATQTLTITQPPPPPTPDAPALTVDKITLSLAQPGNSTATFNISSNIAWTAHVDPVTTNWLTVTPTIGSGTYANATAKATSANTTTAPRFASIVVIGNGVPPQTLIATQAAANSTGLAPTGATLPIGATLTLTSSDPDAPDEPPLTITYTVAANNTLTTDFNPPATDTFAYEYNATGNYGTLIIPDLDSVCSLQFTTATAGTLALYGFDNNGPYEETGTFIYTPPAMPTYALTVTTAAGTTSTTNVAGATVNITANPAPSGQVFDHWTSSPSVTFANANNATTTFTMPATATTVTAYYKDQTAGGGNTGGSGNSSSGGGGGGGGGAPSLFYLAAASALLALRAKRC